MYEMAQTLTGAKVIKGCDGIKISTLGADVDSWDPTDPRVDVSSFGINEA